jgi:acetate kinase
MGTRSRDVDPGLFAYLGRVAGLDAGAVTDALNGSSGLLGLSGTSNDMRTVEAAAEAGDERAELAVDVFTARLAKAVAALAVPLERRCRAACTCWLRDGSSSCPATGTTW